MEVHHWGTRLKESKLCQNQLQRHEKNVKYDTRMFKIMERGKRYIVFLTHRTIFPSRKINFVELKYLGFECLFSAMGWLPLVSMNKVFYPRLVRCFYSNMTYEDERLIKIYANGIKIKFGVRELC